MHQPIFTKYLVVTQKRNSNPISTKLDNFKYSSNQKNVNKKQ